MKMETQTLRIFLVDDDLFSLHLYSGYIRNLGYSNLTLFQDGSACINSLSNDPDIIFLDHNMDNLSGFEVLKKIKRYNPNIYVVMLSAQESITTAVESLKYGAFDYIIKGDNDYERIENVIYRIKGLQEVLKRKKSPVFLSIFKYL
jgi:DNA-binding NtrC family response regulator